jgi:hypothetical protein
LASEAVELSPSQRGKIAEYYVATALMAGSGGRLSPFVPLTDDHGIDLVVLDKVTGGSVAIQVKSWFGRNHADRKTVQFDVRKSTYQEESGTILLAVVLDEASMTMEIAWLIPMSVLPTVSVVQIDKFAIAPSRSHSSRDRYSRFRHLNVPSLSQAVQEMIADRAG